ncbi:MAG: hypothetical protein IKN56_05670 [Clostridia bacterium]|nr:hypothetical protein [Clostridia bacterium]MBR6360438.1 hypothetical protein [Clostridia bacterium]
MKKAKVLLAALLTCILVFSIFTVSFAEDKVTAETEPNEDTAHATEFDMEGTATGSISDVSDTDVFKFKASKNGIGTVTVYAKGSDDYAVSVKDSAGKELKAFVAAGSETDSDEFDLIAEAEYYIEIKANSTVTGSGSYTLEVTNAVYANAEKEPNNELANATPIALDTAGNSKEYYGAVSSGDADYFSFQAKQGYAFIELKKIAKTAGTIKAQVVTIQTTGGAEKVIAEVSNDKTDTYEMSSDIGTKAFTYYIKVTGAGAYTVKAHVRQNAENEYEPNDDTVYANTFTSGQRRFGNLSYVGDIDMFKIVTTESDKNIALVFAADTSTSDKRNDPAGVWNVEILNGNKESIGNGVVTFDKTFEFNLAEQGEGTYYIRITASNYSKGAYIITTKAVDAPQSGNLWDRIKALDWKKFWNDNSFGELMKNVDLGKVLKTVFQLSFGTIFQWLMQLIASRA